MTLYPLTGAESYDYDRATANREARRDYLAETDLSPEQLRERIMFQNAIDFYGLPSTVPALEGQTRVW